MKCIACVGLASRLLLTVVAVCYQLAQAAEDIDPALKDVSPSALYRDHESQPNRPQPPMRAPVVGHIAVDESGAERLGLIQAVRMAVDWHPSIAEAVGTLYAQGEQINVARAGYYPQVSGGVRTGYDSSYRGDGSSQTLNLSIKQMIYDFGKVDSSVNVARARVARSQANILLSIDQVSRDTSYAWIEVQRYEHLMATAREQIKGLMAITRMARERAEKGASTRSDVVQAVSREDGAHATLQQYQAQYRRWRATLASLLGRVTPFEVGDDFPPSVMKSCDTAERDIGMLPAVLAAQAQRIEARAQLDQARSEGLPTLSIDPTLSQSLDQNYDAFDRDRDRTQLGVFLNFNVPIYQGGATTARTASAAHALTAADSAEDVARLQAMQGLLEAKAQTFDLARRLDSLRHRQGSIAEARELYGQQYLQLGTRPLLDLLNAEQEIHQSRFDLENTLADSRRLQIDCLYNTGTVRSVYRIDNSVVQGVRIQP